MEYRAIVLSQANYGMKPRQLKLSYKSISWQNLRAVDIDIGKQAGLVLQPY